MEDVLTIHKEYTDGVTIVRLSGELDALNVSELEAAVAGLSHEESRFIVVDLQFAVDEAVGRGGELLREPTDMGAGQFAVIRDPAGAVCALFQPAEPAADAP